jgi:hypothetical protein
MELKGETHPPKFVGGSTLETTTRRWLIGTAVHLVCEPLLSVHTIGRRDLVLA